MDVKRHYHVYECPSCIVAFAVEAAFEDQSEVKCPVCGDDDIDDAGYGQMVEVLELEEDEDEG